MKKKIVALLSLILALVMSFSLIACNGNDGDDDKGNTTGGNEGNNQGNTQGGNEEGKEPTVAEMTQKAAKAVAEFVGSDGAKFTMDVKLASKSGVGVDMSIDAEKSGNIVKAVIPVTGGEGNQVNPIAENNADEKQTVIVNLETGYAYTVKTVDGKLTVVDYNGMCAGLYEYVDYMLGSFAADDADYTALADYVTYDKTNSTVTLSYDCAEKLNDFTDPLYRGYKGKQNVTWLIEEYIDLLSDGTLGLKKSGIGKLSIYDYVIKFVGTMQNQTIGENLDILKTPAGGGIDVEKILKDNDIDVEAMLKQIGIDVTWEQIRARKLGDAIVGAYVGLGDVIGGIISPAPKLYDGQDGEGDGNQGEGDGMSAVLMQALYDALNGALTYKPTENDPKADAVIKTLLDTVIGVTDGFKVNSLIDEYVQPNVPELYAAIKSGLQVKKAIVELSVKLDKNDKLDELNVSALFSHDYKADEIPEDFVVLSDNDYKATVTIKASGTAAGKIDTDFVYDGELLNNHSIEFPTAVIYGEIKEDVKVYIDLAGADKKQGFKIEVVDDKGLKDTVATFDEKSSCIVFKASYIKEAIAANRPYISVDVKVSYSDEEDYPPHTSKASVSLIYLPDTIEDYGPFAESMIKDILGGMIGGEPENPEIGSEPENPEIGGEQEQLAA